MRNTLSLDIQCRHNEFDLDINQQIELMGITGVFGPSGSGKTTLLRTIAGLSSDAIGSVKINDLELMNSDQNHFVSTEKRHISLVFQDARLFPHLSVQDNLTFAIKRCKNKTLLPSDIIELTAIDGLLKRSVDKLSAGEKQRVALARALLSEPKLLLLDEPLSALDQRNKDALLWVLKKVQQKLQIPMLYVSHHLPELQYLCDQLLTINNGRVYHYGDIHNVIHQLNSRGIIKQQTSLSLTVCAIDKQHGLLSLELDQQQIQMAYAASNGLNQDHFNTEVEVTAPHQKIKQQKITDQVCIGDTLRCIIFASDISLSLDEPKNSSIVNKLLAEITHITQQHYQVLIEMRCGHHQFFAAISSLSFQKLQLKQKQKVYMQFKASAVQPLVRLKC